MSNNKQQINFLLKFVYWIAILAAAAAVFYIGWEVFTVIYSGTH